ncbi:hypothetical protein QF046_000054 [Microbacterium sp. W4I4]|uniref:DUF2795 domain-containing protein n=1 Tax=Microbacterium sp. W4I4 TaxID=3042295 RepID=UPI00277DB75E|nr:DUF2795 domain-containing protein [Microbacterium sp. W4I4]MDQ0612413.1 hypothetical protein [Microbacterium sp. W4I4]
MKTTAVSALERFITDMEYPATKDDLVREASRDGLAAEDIAALRALPGDSYDARCRVRDALAALVHAGRALTAT